MEINHLQPKVVMQNAQTGAKEVAPDVHLQDAKPILDGGLKVTVAERNVLDDIEKLENVEEPMRDDKMGTLIRAAYEMAIPQMPNFV